MRFLPALLPLLVATATLPAQVPTDQVVILETTNVPATPRCKFADAMAMGFEIVPPTPVTLALPFTPTAIAVDPASAQQLWVLGPENTPNAGIHAITIGPFATASGPIVSQPWTQSGGTRLRVGATDLFTLRAGGIVERTPKNGGAPTIVLQRPDAVDIAVIDARVYVACRDTTNPANVAPLIEVDTTTNTQRVVGSYPDMLCVGTSNEFAPRLSIGTGFGAAVELDPVNGAIGNVLAATGPVERIGFWRIGPMFWAVSTTNGFDVWSVSGLVYQQPLGTILDFDMSAARTPSVAPFGAGCGAATNVAWSANGLPAVGNASFALSLSGAPANQPLALFFGINSYNRWISLTFGIALPIDLGALAPGCQLFVDPAVVLSATADANGAVTLPLPVASNTFAGTDWSGQAFVLDPAVGPLGLAGSAAVVCRIEN